MTWINRRIQKLKKGLFGAKWQENQSGVYHLTRWIAEAAEKLGSDAWVLDAGSGPAPFRRFFSQVNYETADHLKNPYEYFPPTYTCDLSSIPVADCRYDMILCTQVLEHLPNPDAVLKEFARVLKNDGILLLSAPLYFEEHEGPYDFYRYTQWGLRTKAEGAGFVVKEIDWVEGYYATLAHQLAIASQSLAKTHVTKVSRWFELLPMHILIFSLRILFGFLAGIFMKLDMRAPDRSHGHCINYRVVLCKQIECVIS